jgi:AraC-like DNA-binding protein
MMQMIRYRPAAPLDTYVECFWWSQRDQPETFGEHMLPSGSSQLVVALHDAPIACLSNSPSGDTLVWSRGVVHGPQWSYYKSGPKPAGATAGVAFRPGAAGAILGLPIAELTDRHVAIDALWGARGQELREKLLAARGATAVFGVLERDLGARLKRPLLIHPAVAHPHTFRSNACASRHVADVQREAGYSPKHFIGLFRAAVGLTPKHFYRLNRFTAVLRRLAHGDAESLADLAVSAGYSDQSHLTREFREFAGITPTQYSPRSPVGILHHRVSDSSIGRFGQGKKISRPS